ncbi:putative mitochondrial protein [Andalucia godoyi]|uniref:Putative mitochondrial protein n=1 Tax=Andalucia godoyi TaxID=505711 RepID=A0A8K0AGS3_ANDGO|nr:putative mitochondrial protein [Andalucia godoyi]|eukprot:ANDGO_01743.mRNA.1 putative mitochondrial protein
MSTTPCTPSRKFTARISTPATPASASRLAVASYYNQGGPDVAVTAADSSVVNFFSSSHLDSESASKRIELMSPGQSRTPFHTNELLVHNMGNDFMLHNSQKLNQLAMLNTERGLILGSVDVRTESGKDADFALIHNHAYDEGYISHAGGNPVHSIVAVYDAHAEDGAKAASQTVAIKTFDIRLPSDELSRLLRNDLSVTLKTVHEYADAKTNGDGQVVTLDAKGAVRFYIRNFGGNGNADLLIDTGVGNPVKNGLCIDPQGRWVLWTTKDMVLGVHFVNGNSEWTEYGPSGAKKKTKPAVLRLMLPIEAVEMKRELELRDPAAASKCQLLPAILICSKAGDWENFAHVQSRYGPLVIQWSIRELKKAWRRIQSGDGAASNGIQPDVVRGHILGKDAENYDVHTDALSELFAEFAVSDKGQVVGIGRSTFNVAEAEDDDPDSRNDDDDEEEEE